jgi:hypothetical protein
VYDGQGWTNFEVGAILFLFRQQLAYDFASFNSRWRRVRAVKNNVVGTERAD